MRIQSVKLNRETMHLPVKILPLVWFILQRPPFFTRKNGRIDPASDSLFSFFNLLLGVLPLPGATSTRVVLKRDVLYQCHIG